MPSSPRTASDAAELERSRLQFEKMTQTPVPKRILGLAAPTYQLVRALPTATSTGFHPLP